MSNQHIQIGDLRYFDESWNELSNKFFFITKIQPNEYCGLPVVAGMVFDADEIEYETDFAFDSDIDSRPGVTFILNCR